MPKFRVEIVQETTVCWERVFEAPSEDRARALAEADDWTQWAKLSEGSSIGIDIIECLGD